MDSGEIESSTMGANGTTNNPQPVQGDESDLESDSSDDEESEKLIDGNIQKLLLDVEASPFQYDKHIKLITALRASFDLDRLRSAREAMARIYPLTEDLWLEWFTDELPLATIAEQKEYLVTKFELAVKDYTSVKVWHEYCQYMMNNIDCPADIEKARQVFEQAITAVGLHVTEGSSIWDGYREFEIAILDSYQQLEESGEASGMCTKVESQIERIAGLFRRQLAVPLLGLDSVYEGFEDWYEQPIPGETKRLYERASQKLTLLMEYEEKLCNAEGKKLSAYLSYIDYEIQGGDPARIQCIFERAIKDNCLDYELWTRYTDYLDFKLKIPAIAVSAHHRATRNCPWVGTLWHNYLNAVERSGAETELYLDVFNEALKGGFAGKDAYLQLLITKCDYFRRQITDWTQDIEKVKELQKSFESGIAYMEHYFGSDGDTYCVLLREQAFVEAKHLGNVKGAQELWDLVMKKHSRNSNMWIEYLSFLKEFSDVLTVRRAFQRAVQVAFENPLPITEEFLKFERRHGTLCDVESAQQKISLHLRKAKERKEREIAKESEKNEEDRGTMSNNRKKSKNKFEKRVGKQDHQLQEEAVVPQKNNSERRNNKAKRHIKTSPLSQPCANKKTRESMNGCEDEHPKGSNAELPGSKMTGSAKSEKEGDQVPTSTNITNDDSIAKSVHDRTSGTEVSDGTTEDFVVDKVDSELSVFLSNMPIAADETHIRELFAPCGDIEKIHIVRNIKGKSKGFAYLQFNQKDSVSKALSLDRKTMLNRPLYVSECTDKKVNPTQFQYPTALDKRTLYVSNIPFEATAEQVTAYFSNGSLKDLRLVTRKDGRTKGIAYAEYETEAGATAALMTFDKQVFMGRPLNVNLSNPPTRKQPDKAGSKTENIVESRPDAENKTSYKGRTRDAPGSRGKAKTQVSLVPRAFIPRSVAAPKPGSIKTPAMLDTADSSAGSSVDSNASGPMNNSDFRKFLLK